MMGETLHDELRERGLFPHQVEFILTALGSGSGSRLLLADAVGLGKTRACVSSCMGLEPVAWQTTADVDSCTASPASQCGRRASRTSKCLRTSLMRPSSVTLRLVLQRGRIRGHHLT